MWPQAWSLPGRATGASAHSATSRQRLGPGRSLPVPRLLSNPLAVAGAGSMSPTPHPSPLLMWHSWPKGAGPVLPQDTCFQMRSFFSSAEDFNKCIQLCTHNAQMVGTPGLSLRSPLWPSGFIALRKSPSPRCYVSHSCTVSLLSQGLPGPGFLQLFPARNLTFPSFHLPFTTYNFLGSSSRIHFPFGKNRSWLLLVML